MKKIIYFDMDGTLCDFYGVRNWIPRIQHNDASIYYEARPIEKNIALLKEYKKAGYKIIILTCLSYNTNKKRDIKSRMYKRMWLDKYLNGYIDSVRIIPYTHHKEWFVNEAGILVDDNDKVLNNWPWYKVRIKQGGRI